MDGPGKRFILQRPWSPPPHNHTSTATATVTFPFSANGRARYFAQSIHLRYIETFMRLNKVVCIQSTKLEPKQNRSAIGIPSNNFSLIARVDYVFSNDTNFIFDECFCCWRCCFYCCSGILLKCRSPMYLRLFLIPHRHLPIPVSIYFAFGSTISLSVQLSICISTAANWTIYGWFGLLFCWAHKLPSTPKLLSPRF